MTRAMTITTSNKPVQMPALNIPAIASQELSETIKTSRKLSEAILERVIPDDFIHLLQKPYPQPVLFRLPMNGTRAGQYQGTLFLRLTSIILAILRFQITSARPKTILVPAMKR